MEIVALFCNVDNFCQRFELPLRPICAICLRSRLVTQPPIVPAWRASSLVTSWALPCACTACPPRGDISRCCSGSIAANPRRFLVVITSRLPST